jgi:hypothetical protein
MKGFETIITTELLRYDTLITYIILLIDMIPGFNAEESLLNSDIYYNKIMRVPKIQIKLIPQQIIDCFLNCDSRMLSCYNHCASRNRYCRASGGGDLCSERASLCLDMCDDRWFICSTRCGDVLLEP